jgi:hypothetical protein
MSNRGLASTLFGLSLIAACSSANHSGLDVAIGTGGTGGVAGAAGNGGAAGAVSGGTSGAAGLGGMSGVNGQTGGTGGCYPIPSPTNDPTCPDIWAPIRARAQLTTPCTPGLVCHLLQETSPTYCRQPPIAVPYVCCGSEFIKGLICASPADAAVDH